MLNIFVNCRFVNFIFLILSLFLLQACSLKSGKIDLYTIIESVKSLDEEKIAILSKEEDNFTLIKKDNEFFFKDNDGALTSLNHHFSHQIKNISVIKQKNVKDGDYSILKAFDEQGKVSYYFCRIRLKYDSFYISPLAQAGSDSLEIEITDDGTQLILEKLSNGNLRYWGAESVKSALEGPFLYDLNAKKQNRHLNLEKTVKQTQPASARISTKKASTQKSTYSPSLPPAIDFNTEIRTDNNILQNEQIETPELILHQ